MSENNRHSTQTLLPSGFNIGVGKFRAGITTRNNRLFYYIVFIVIACFFLHLTISDFPQYSLILPLFIVSNCIFLCTILVLKPRLFDSEEHIESMQELAMQGNRDTQLKTIDTTEASGNLYSASTSPSTSLSPGKRQSLKSAMLPISSSKEKV